MKIMGAMTKAQPPQHHVKHQGMVFVLEIVQQAQITIAANPQENAGSIQEQTEQDATNVILLQDFAQQFQTEFAHQVAQQAQTQIAVNLQENAGSQAMVVMNAIKNQVHALQ